MLLAVNSTLRRQRRRMAALAVVLALAGAVVATHSVMSHDHMGDAALTCLAVAQTAVLAVGATLAAGAFARRSLPLPPLLAPAGPRFVVSPVEPRARAGPPSLQVFRL